MLAFDLGCPGFVEGAFREASVFIRAHLPLDAFLKGRVPEPFHLFLVQIADDFFVGLAERIAREASLPAVFEPQHDRRGHVVLEPLAAALFGTGPRVANADANPAEPQQVGFELLLVAERDRPPLFDIVFARRARFGVDRPGPQQGALRDVDDIHALFGEPFDAASLVACGHAVGGCFVGDFIEADLCATHAGQLGVFEVVVLRCGGHRAGGEEQGHRKKDSWCHGVLMWIQVD